MIAPTISLDDGYEWHCLEHADDDFLPQLTTGPVGCCVSCGTMTVLWDRSNHMAMHVECARRLAWLRASEMDVSTKAGAYGRRP